VEDDIPPLPPKHGAAPQYPIESVDNALKVLLLLGQRPTLRVNEVSQYLGVASSSAHRLLSMLLYRGFLRRDEATRAYVAGPSLDDLALRTLGQLEVRNRVHPVLERVNADLGETIHLGRLENADVHFIDAVESTRALRVVGRVGRVMDAHCTSTGKALLSTLTDDQVRALYPHEELAALTPRSIGTRTALLAALADVRARGYATSREESEEGVGSVAVPITTQSMQRLAINASVPLNRMNSTSERRIRARLSDAAEEIAALLM
jgi:DNA-binding IclR family transcriptional regulator